MVVPFLRCRDSLDAIRKFDEAIYQNMENPQIGESTQELKLRRGQRPTLVDAGQDGYAFCLLLFVLRDLEVRSHANTILQRDWDV